MFSYLPVHTLYAILWDVLKRRLYKKIHNSNPFSFLFYRVFGQIRVSLGIRDVHFAQYNQRCFSRVDVVDIRRLSFPACRLWRQSTLPPHARYGYGNSHSAGSQSEGIVPYLRNRYLLNDFLRLLWRRHTYLVPYVWDTYWMKNARSYTLLNISIYSGTTSRDKNTLTLDQNRSRIGTSYREEVETSHYLAFIKGSITFQTGIL